MSTGMNNQQKRAIENVNGPVIINAGPGTGKTRTLVARIAHLIQNHHIHPEHILALTFTQKAAAEMRERLVSILKVPTLPAVSTFHAFAFGILQQERKAVTLISQAERDEILKEIAASQPDVSVRDLSLLITQYKSSFANKKNELVQFYNSMVASRGLMDFDDMLLFLYNILETDSVIRERVQLQYQHIHVDEFQDTNVVQYRILQKVAAQHNNIFVIGDPLQSIYSFRGATPSIFKIFKKDNPKTIEITLTHNYRSGKNIIKVIQSLFPGEKALQPAVTDSGNVQLIDTLNEYTEADYIVNEICSHMGGIDLNSATEHDKSRFSDFAVVYRTHSLARILEQRFSDSAIPYQVIGSNSLYEQKEIRFITTWLFYLYSKNGEYLKIAHQLAEKPFKVEIQNKLEEAAKTLPVSKLVQMIETIFQLRTNLEDTPAKLRNLNQFNGNLIQFDNDPQSLQKAVEYLLYLKEHEYFDPRGDKVTLMTIHAAKGLEFNTIFICAFEEGIIPFIRQQEKTDYEEEKRLLYVAMTRAKKQLFLIRAQTRYKKKSIQSSFELLLDPDFYTKITDTAIEKIALKIHKKEVKKSQLSLF